ncbi:triphosphoribosyl-dephospho-CoA synthase [Rhodopseudomonas palustris]|uniref:Probable 2-(5''-triphosphoribosyl)-3'-dephosphocoenzyme-A synthase n=1 Tax=Rhodopseudomonas palustris (strain BisB18) TaxID=316056 RepID=Q20XM2_RHOPB
MHSALAQPAQQARSREESSFSAPIYALPTRIATLAVQSMIAEASLTPKPGLVDARGPGAHADLDIALMHRSARSLFPCFRDMARAVAGAAPSRQVREKLAAIGREGEAAMFAATAGVNTHKGAIWSLGLLVGGAVMSSHPADAVEIASIAGSIARYSDSRMPTDATNGSRVVERYGVPGARGEAQDGFPHVVGVGLPALQQARSRGVAETFARLDALLAIMAALDDTCLLHRGGHKALETAKSGAAEILRLGGTSTKAGLDALDQLDIDLLELNASPGGSGDLFAATLFLDSLNQLSSGAPVDIDQNGDFSQWKS